MKAIIVPSHPGLNRFLAPLFFFALTLGLATRAHADVQVNSLDGEQDLRLTEQIPRGSGLFPAQISGAQWRGSLSSLEQIAEYRLGVVLLRSFDDAVAPYRSLQLECWVYRDTRRIRSLRFR